MKKNNCNLSAGVFLCENEEHINFFVFVGDIIRSIKLPVNSNLLTETDNAAIKKAKELLKDKNFHIFPHDQLPKEILNWLYTPTIKIIYHMVKVKDYLLIEIETPHEIVEKVEYREVFVGGELVATIQIGRCEEYIVACKSNIFPLDWTEYPL